MQTPVTGQPGSFCQNIVHCHYHPISTNRKTKGPKIIQFGKVGEGDIIIHTPSNLRDPPILPGSHPPLKPCRVPFSSFPDRSAKTVPLVSSKFQWATKPKSSPGVELCSLIPVPARYSCQSRKPSKSASLSLR